MRGFFNPAARGRGAMRGQRGMGMQPPKCPTP